MIKSGNYDPPKSMSWKVLETVLSHLKEARKGFSLYARAQSTPRCMRQLNESKQAHWKLSPVLTSDASISINISIRSLCASEDSRNISISISFFLMLMLMFSEDIVDISISAR